MFVSDTSSLQDPLYVPVCFRYIGPPRPYQRTCLFQIYRASKTLSTYLFVSDTSGLQDPIYVPVCFRYIGPPRPCLLLARGLGRGDRRRLVVDRRYPSNRHAVGWICNSQPSGGTSENGLTICKLRLLLQDTPSTPDALCVCEIDLSLSDIAAIRFLRQWNRFLYYYFF